MIAEIVSVGTELLMGQVLNSDAQYIARRLSEAGVTLHHQTTVGDNPARLREAIEIALSRADIVITTGGLGPTEDDITKELTAEALGLTMEVNPEAEAMVRNWFQRSGYPMTENNLRQANFAHGAKILRNDYGTAPGCIVERLDGKAVINLPGPPRELIPMMDGGVLPYLSAKSGAFIISRYLRIFGMGESKVASLTGDLMERMTNPTIAPYCSTGEVQLRLTVRCDHSEEAASLLDPLEAEVRSRLGDVIYAVTDDPHFTMEQALVETLRKSGVTLAVAESCTGGMIASRIVSVPSASTVLLEGAVTYTNGAKVRALDVPQALLDKHGAVSEEVAMAMAEGFRNRSGANICLSVTGIAGPDGATAEKPVGLVWLGLATGGGVYSKKLQLTGDRQRIRTLAALNGMHWIMKSMLSSAQSTGVIH